MWGILQAQGQKLVKEGKTLEADEQNLAELTEKAQGFAEKQVPVLKAFVFSFSGILCLSAHLAKCLVIA